NPVRRLRGCLEVVSRHRPGFSVGSWATRRMGGATPVNHNGGNTMRNTYGIAAAIALGLGVAWWGGVGRAQQPGVGEQAGEQLDAVGRKLKRGIDRAEDAVREGFHKTRDSVHSMGVAARVYGRLHWDKTLHSSTLQIKVEEGVATISGSVPTAEAK